MEQEAKDEEEVFLACCQRVIPAVWKRRRKGWWPSGADEEDLHGWPELSGAAEEDR